MYESVPVREKKELKKKLSIPQKGKRCLRVSHPFILFFSSKQICVFRRRSLTNSINHKVKEMVRMMMMMRMRNMLTWA
ncbi:hypothetical protein VNO77_01908 [Canavalia gladiata]|uniref:Uncharacterized protein n=1 Tax=Canavalia gladiata TaxID=3824 RepID=A0AAN9MS84_CANGL